jgi:hypothetical protein
MTDPHFSRRARAAQLAAALDGTGDPALVEAVAKRRAACDAIVQLGRQRRFAMKVQQKLDRALESYARINFTAWDPDAPAAEREKRNAEALRLVAQARKGEGPPVLVALAKANAESRAVWDTMRLSTERDMAKVAKALPAAPFCERVHGFALPGLASILAETGTLDGYGNPAKVWSRLGFAPYAGLALSSWKREAWRPRALSAAEWVDHPFKAERYAFMFTLAKPLRDAQWIGASKTDDGQGRPKPGMRYGYTYALRRAHCDITHPDWTPAHRDRAALRVMFKRLLADLWSAWIDTSFALGQRRSDTQPSGAESEKAAAGHVLGDTQEVVAGGGSLPPDAPQAEA